MSSKWIMVERGFAKMVKRMLQREESCWTNDFSGRSSWNHPSRNGFLEKAGGTHFLLALFKFAIFQVFILIH